MSNQNEKPTIKQVEQSKFSDLAGETKTGATNAIKYKIVAVSDDHADEVIAVSNAGGKIYTIRDCEPALWSQFLHRGC